MPLRRVALVAGIAAVALAPNAQAAGQRLVGGATPSVDAPAATGEGGDTAVPVTRLRGVVSGRAEVRELQRALGVRADGRIGPKTRAALRRAQRKAGLRADGVPRRATLAKLGIVTRTVPSASGTTAAPAIGEEPPLVTAARSRIGSPYEWGSTGPDTFDCSGLVTWSAAQSGIDVPRVSFDQYKVGRPVARNRIQAGDLVFFDTAGPGASDVGIATGPRTVISATTSRGVVEHATFDRYWGSHFVGARRLG
ncbi:C40 family peptidase [Conexibacter arvalis]|uniref:Cell wall-associated NlpC family hydrolase n=1 Tax=Conexibacter arvalis TaxID=912552 RepID=A0A840IKS4_9ACTN|nr:NlpC/P60 family protein [Conexibacter arvalis]MBB4664520.1 cell wall-associated NlpC family hydrolase [Conexibacter arvalis]